MKHTILIAYFFVVIAILYNETANAQQTFFDLNTIQKIEIYFAQSNWDYQLDSSKIGNDGYIMAQWIKINGVELDSVGVKFKGNSSYDSTYLKNPYHLNLSKFKSQSYQNLTSIKLSNCYADPSMIREVLSYNILKNYMDCSRSNFAELYINGSYIGLYSNVEDIDKQFCSNHFYTSSNTVIKCNPANPGPSQKSNLKYIASADSSAYFNLYEINSTYGWNDLKNLCDSVTNHPTTINTVLDIDKTLWMLAFDNVSVNLDSYMGVFCQNYYLCKDNNNIFNPVIWDLNMSLGGFPYAGYSISSMGTLTVANMQQLSLTQHSTDTYWPLINDIMSNAMYKKMYIAHAKTLTTEMFASNYYQTLGSQMMATIDTAVQSDSNKFFTYAQFQNCLTSNTTSGSQIIPGISNLMGARVSYLQSTADFNYSQPVISFVSNNNPSPNINGTVTITAHVTNTNTSAVYIYFRFNNTEEFTPALMYDDGNHNDTLAGDNIYGVSFTMDYPTLQYYIYAENSSAGVFSPQRAAHEYYTITASIPVAVPGQVVINEFLAKNISGTTNESGVFADWIELYNTTSIGLNLSGLYLTDNYSLPTKFAFPSNTMIAPNGYMIVWADDGTSTSTAIHANFKLSENGEELMLSNGSGSVLDSITFGVQTSDVSMGRCPDGSGAFIFMSTPTFDAHNICPDDGIITPNKTINIVKIYPNPASDLLTIDLLGATAMHNTTLSIFNLQGQLLFQQEINREKTSLDLNTFAKGMYIVKICNDKNSLVSKFAKQ